MSLKTMLAVLSCCLVFSASRVALAQGAAVSPGVAAPQAGSRFAVASLREAAPADPNSGTWSLPGIGKFEATHVPLPMLLQLAFGVNARRIVGGPAWMGDAFYDIKAKPEDGISLSRDELKPMLQDLFAQRLHLVTHRETRTEDGFELLVAKGGAHLTEFHGKEFPGWRVNVSPGRLEGRNWTMAHLAQELTGPAERFVVDRTGLTGSYDVSLKYATAPDSDELPLAAALRQTLGLELRRAPVPVEVVVIDHVDRVPAEN